MPLIVIEGLDGSGKHTQAEMLQEAIPGAVLIDFPRYQNPSSYLVREHLAGHTSPDPTVENPYAAATYFAADRVISYHTEDWGKALAENKTVIMDRYTTSVLIYQAAKLPDYKRKEYCRWVWDYETNRLQLPKPDLVIFIDLHPDIAMRLAKERAAKGQSHDKNISGSLDLYEKNREYQMRCYHAAYQATSAYHWETVFASDKFDEMRTKENIHDDILSICEKKGLVKL